MVKPVVVPASSSDAVMRTLAWARKSGFRPVPLRPRSKAAVSRDYASLDYRPPDDDLWRRQQYELGVVLGPKHKGPVDVDLDCNEALFFAPRFLPPTDAVFGRPGKPKSHYLYRVDLPELDKKAFIDPVSNATIVEIRADGGHQTVMPGSIHEGTGELIEWAGPPFPEVTQVSAELLTRAARMVALATLIARHVWQPGYHNEPCKHLSGLLYYLDWPLDDAVALITAVMEFTGDTDKSRIPTVRATYRRGEAGKKVSGAGVLRKQLGDDRVVDRILEWAGSPSVNAVQEYNDKFAVVSVEGKFRIADFDVSPGEPPVFYHKDDFLGLTATDYSDQVNAQGKPLSKARVWLANPRRRQYRAVDFVPGADDTSFLNLWTGWAVQPSAEGSCAAWLELLRDVICNKDRMLYNWMLHWFANIVREPADKSLTAPVIIGVPGAGKTLLVDYFGKILGPAYVPVTNEEHIHGRFNKHLGHALLLHSEEALYAGDKRHAGIIRSLITDKHRIFEQKGIDAKKVSNYLRVILTSEEQFAAPVKAGDRRYTVVMLGDRKLSRKLLDRVVAERDGGGPAALHHYLLNMKYDPGVARVNVKSRELMQLKAANFTPIESWWHDCLYEGEVLPRFLAWATQPEQEAWPSVVAGPALHTALSLRMRERGQRGSVSDTLLGLQLQRFTGKVLERARRNFNNPLLDEAPMAVKQLGDRMSAVIDLPSLDDCRRAFERYVGQEIDWPKDDSGAPESIPTGPQF